MLSQDNYRTNPDTRNLVSETFDQKHIRGEFIIFCFKHDFVEYKIIPFGEQKCLINFKLLSTSFIQPENEFIDKIKLFIQPSAFLHMCSATEIFRLIE